LTWPQIAVHHQWIADQLAVPVTVATIAQRLRDDHQVEVSESTVRRYVATTFTEQRLEDRVTVPRGAVEPGSEAQIDYGKLGMWCDPASGRRVAVWVFAMILSCSRALFVQPVLKMDQTSWNSSHVAGFEFFGGVPARLVPDYVARHIIGVLCPVVLCARPRENLASSAALARVWAHKKSDGNTIASWPCL
jgi:transposase